MSETLISNSAAGELPEADARLSALSDEARALFAELNDETDTEPAVYNTATEEATAMPQQMADMAPVDLPVAPINDPRAGQFISLLEHLDDEATPPDDVAFDENSAIEAAQQWRKARAAEPADIRPENYEATTGADAARIAGDANNDADNMAEQNDVEDMNLLLADADMPARPVDGDADDGFDLLDDDFDESIFDEDEDGKKTGLKGGFFSRFRGKSAGVRSLIGFKDAGAAYNAQSGRSLLPFTIIRSVVLLLVAAVPPLVNLLIIQPQISDNNRKLTELRKFEADAQESQKIAARIANQVIREQKTAKTLFASLAGTEEFEPLIAAYIDALQRYDIDLRSYNVAVDENRRVVFGNMQAEANIVELELRGRYDVYHEIRRVFVEESKLVTVLQEKLEAVPGEVELKITSKLLVPSKGQGQDDKS